MAQLGKVNQKMLRKTLAHLHTQDNWQSTGEMAKRLGVKPAQIRPLLNWELKNHPNGKLVQRKLSARNVEWRLRQTDKGAVVMPVAVKQQDREPHPDDSLIGGLANSLGQKEAYRQGLIRIRNDINQLLGE